MEKELTLVEENPMNLSDKLEEYQEKFLSSYLGKIVNNAIDIGLKSLLPDLIEDEIIDIKDSIIESGFKEGLKEAIETAINFGKSAIGIVTGNFENSTQIEIAVKKGGMIDSISDLLDKTVKSAQDKNMIDKSTANLIKDGKDTILANIESKVENTLKTQVKNIEKLETYCDKWNNAFERQDFSEMTKIFKNVEKYLNRTIPFENTIIEARKIENLQNLIKNNGGNFNISEEEKKLAQMLVN